MNFYLSGHMLGYMLQHASTNHKFVPVLVGGISVPASHPMFLRGSSVLGEVGRYGVFHSSCSSTLSLLCWDTFVLSQLACSCAHFACCSAQSRSLLSLMFSMITEQNASDCNLAVSANSRSSVSTRSSSFSILACPLVVAIWCCCVF